MTTPFPAAIRAGHTITSFVPDTPLTTEELGAYAQTLGNLEATLIKARRVVDLAYVGRLLAVQHPEIASVKFNVDKSSDYDGSFVPANVHGATHDGVLAEDQHLFNLLNNNLSEDTFRDLYEDHWYSEDADEAGLPDPYVLFVAEAAAEFTDHV